MDMKRFNYLLEIDILRNSSQKVMGVLRCAFEALGVQKGTQMPCWLRPWLRQLLSEAQDLNIF